MSDRLSSPPAPVKPARPTCGHGNDRNGGWPVAPAGEGECVVVDPHHVHVESICSDADLASCGLHWFQVFFETGSGRCFITAGEARRLPQLNSDWVKRALVNLVAAYGSSWVEFALTSQPGLLLHYFDADEPGRPGRTAAEPALVDASGAEAAPAATSVDTAPRR